MFSHQRSNRRKRRETDASNGSEKISGVCVKKHSRSRLHLGNRTPRSASSVSLVTQLCPGCVKQYSCRPWSARRPVSAEITQLENTLLIHLFAPSLPHPAPPPVALNENQMFSRGRTDPRPSCFAGEVGQHLCKAHASTGSLTFFPTSITGRQLRQEPGIAFFMSANPALGLCHCTHTVKGYK